MGAHLRRACQARGVMSPASPESTLGSAILPWRLHSCGQKMYTFSVYRRTKACSRVEGICNESFFTDTSGIYKRTLLYINSRDQRPMNVKKKRNHNVPPSTLHRH